ncbi:MAG TPA: acetyl-CoA C-acyltransferase [Acidimicrobiales bacterium]|nr:acetyl-CoA C-acyltransferase [Acidimicrobiales bacterium]
MERARAVHLVDALRTPIGKVRGSLSSVRPDDLAATVLQAILERNPSVPPDAVDDVAFGNVNQAGEDNRNVARMALLIAGLPVTTAGVTVNRLCGSSLDAFLHAFRAIALGETDVAIAGGVESMSRSPFVIARPEQALPPSLELVDSTIGWRFTNPLMPEEWTVSMGMTAENLAGQYDISRERQDAFALRSHQRAVEAAEKGLFDSELVAVETADATVSRDEGPRATTSLAALAGLRPAFRRGGTVTAGNSSSINDGASAALLVSEEALERYGLASLGRVLGGAVAGVRPEVMGIGPVPATARLLGRLGWELADLAAVELNEAFAAQSLAVLSEWGVPDDWAPVNAEGGAIALGHPLGCSGVRLVATLVHRLRRRGGGRGLATMCIGVGQGIAVAIEAE